jgi:hypothetical protein
VETGRQDRPQRDVLVPRGSPISRIVLSRAEGLAERRLRAIDAVAGSLAGAYEPGELDRLRAEWR